MLNKTNFFTIYGEKTVEWRLGTLQPPVIDLLVFFYGAFLSTAKERRKLYKLSAQTGG